MDVSDVNGIGHVSMLVDGRPTADISAGTSSSVQPTEGTLY